MKEIIIYHGSEKEITVPSKDKGKKYNDFGQGFYCTISKELASQWACKFQEDGIVNEYIIDTENLNVLYLNEQYHILNWLAILVDNREITGSVAISNAKYLFDHYGLDYKKYDLIIGYRADDAYFRFVREFLNNTIGLITLDEAMYLGKLGLQVFIQSERAFQATRFINSFIVYQEEYFTKSNIRIEKAVIAYEQLKVEYDQNDIFMREIKGGNIDENSIPKIKVE